MAAVAKNAALKLDWTSLGNQLGLKGATASALAAFKKRNDDARRRLAILSEQSQTVDFAHYRRVLVGVGMSSTSSSGSQPSQPHTIVDEIERKVAGFKPVTYDIARTLKAIDAFEAEAIKQAQQTKSVVDSQSKQLQIALENIEQARPFADLTTDEVAAACPEIDARTEQMTSNNRWVIPGYKEKFGDLSVL